MPPLAAPQRPVAALTVALSVTFGCLAFLVAHALHVHELSAAEFYAIVGLACVASLPTTWAAARLQARASRDGTSLLRPLLVTVAVGVLLGIVAQLFTISVMEPWETLWFEGISLGKDRVVWLLFGASLGAVVASLAFVFVAVGLGALRRSPAVHDAQERLGVPGLSIATVAAACALFVLNPDELVGGITVVALGLGFLTVMLLRDARRVAFVRRVFAGAEPNVELITEVTDAERGTLHPLADVWCDVVLADRQEGPAYRRAARGRGLMLLGETSDQTLAPVRRRMRFAAVCCAAALVAGLGRAVVLAYQA